MRFTAGRILCLTGRASARKTTEPALAGVREAARRSGVRYLEPFSWWRKLLLLVRPLRMRLARL